MDEEDELAKFDASMYATIMTLNERVWEDRADRPSLERWLKNFSEGVYADDDRRHALYLLSRFMYFGDREVREMLRAVFRDLYKYPIVSNIRRRAGDTNDRKKIEEEFLAELNKTRFLGIGNPSESGTHLLYYFRQENSLSKEHFINSYEMFTSATEGPKTEIRNPAASRYVFLDDFCGTGTQAFDYSKNVVSDLKRLYKAAGAPVRVSYFVLCATTSGLNRVRSETLFDEVECVLELDGTYACFGPESRYYGKVAMWVNSRFAKNMAETYGRMLKPEHPLGFENAQLLIGFHHNTPDNTLPIIWYDEPEHREWQPIFRRYPKIAYRGSKESP